jgi:hypothetical protein
VILSQQLEENGGVEGCKKRENSRKYYLGHLKVKTHLWDLRVDGRLILK